MGQRCEVMFCSGLSSLFTDDEAGAADGRLAKPELGKTGVGGCEQRPCSAGQDKRRGRSRLCRHSRRCRGGRTKVVGAEGRGGHRASAHGNPWRMTSAPLPLSTQGTKECRRVQRRCRPASDRVWPGRRRRAQVSSDCFFTGKIYFSNKAWETHGGRADANALPPRQNQRKP